MKKAILAIGICVLVIGVVLVALPFVNIPTTTSEPYEVQRSSVILNENFEVGDFFWVIHSAHLEKEETVNIQVTLSKEGLGDVIFVVSEGGEEFIRQQGVDFVYNENWTVPYSADYNFRYSKTAPYGAKNVTELVTKYWTETAYMDVPLLSFEVAYLGIALVLVGIGITAYGVVKKETVPTVTQQTPGNQ